MTESQRQQAKSSSSSSWNAVLVGLVCFMAGLLVGANFMGTRPAATPHSPANQVGDLPPGHPPIDTASNSASQSRPPEADPHYDDPAVRAEIEAANDPDALVRIGNREFDAVPRHSALAAAAYEKALKLRPNNPDVMTDLGTVYRDMGRFDDAIRMYRKAASIDPKHANSWYNQGVVLLHDKNDIKGAIAAWEEYLRVAPNGQHADDVRSSLAELRKRLQVLPQ
ncbi:MAG: tetratricopeptide repeat protein [Armatimonadota bacterium]